MDTINLLMTLDRNYLPQLMVLLTSIHLNNPGESFAVYLIHSGIPSEDLERVAALCRKFTYGFSPVLVDGSSFQHAPVTKQYPQEMYYRLLAPHLLPRELEKILYLDPDILVINPLRPLWELDLQGCLFGAAAHSGKTELVNSVNRVRLGTDHDYYNSGVLLMDLEAGRREIVPEELFAYAAEHPRELLLPDQDMLNVLFGARTLPLNDVLWNYDARDFHAYQLSSGGTYTLNWVLSHTAILHFCGKSKPWKKGYVYRFGLLYKHYVQITSRLCAERNGFSGFGSG